MSNPAENEYLVPVRSDVVYKYPDKMIYQDPYGRQHPAYSDKHGEKLFYQNGSMWAPVPPGENIVAQGGAQHYTQPHSQHQSHAHHSHHRQNKQSAGIGRPQQTMSQSNGEPKPEMFILHTEIQNAEQRLMEKLLQMINEAENKTSNLIHGVLSHTAKNNTETNRRIDTLMARVEQLENGTIPTSLGNLR